MDTTLPIPETAMPKISQNLLSDGIDGNTAAEYNYCKATDLFWKNCPKLKKKRETEDKSGKISHRPTYPECTACRKTHHSTESCCRGTGAHLRPEE